MRLINTATLKLEDFYTDTTPPYTILSHTWGNDEVSYDEFVHEQDYLNRKSGYQKLLHFVKLSHSNGLKYAWMDACCIDKKSSAELSEAINSMYTWYRKANACYAFLEDVSIRTTPNDAQEDWVSDFSTDQQADSSKDISWKSAFAQCRWFHRGWTLQELIAPQNVVFYSKEWAPLGTRESLIQDIQVITGIDEGALRGRNLWQYSVEDRLSWAAHRETTRAEDGAYCLLGLFDVNMPLLYGEGMEKAFRRLSEEIDKNETFEKRIANRRDLFNQRRIQRRLPRPPQHSPVSHTVTLQENTSLADNEWVYPCTRLSGHRFRILVLEQGKRGDRLLGQLQEFDLSNPPPYYALSYAWGHEPDLHPISINGKQKLIRSNLFHALQRIRLKSGPIHIWIDSICINQDDKLEMNSQVTQMARVYKSAEGVLIWLGEEDSTSRAAIDHINAVIEPKFQWNDLWWKEFGFIALAKLLDRAWFQRRWVLQEAALASNSTIHCGDRQIHMDSFANAVHLISARLMAMKRSLENENQGPPSDFFAKFYDSPALTLLHTIADAFHRGDDGSILYPKMSLETLAHHGRLSEASDQRDTIYALLSLANDITIPAEPVTTEPIVPDYGKPLLDVYADFILHCVCRSGSLDIICRPWAPSLASEPSSISRLNVDDMKLDKLPSWVATSDRLPFGDPFRRSNHRLHGKSLVGSDESRTYTCHHTSKACVRVGRNTDTGRCDGALYAKGIIIGEVAKRSTRMANAIITKECLGILGTVAPTRPDKLPDAFWRTLCADRDEDGKKAQPAFSLAMRHLLELSCESPTAGDAASLLENLSSVDIEELLDSNLPAHIRRFSEIVMDTVWNRRTFRTYPLPAFDGTERVLAGLIPPSARLKDRVCILFGCSVPVVLRQIFEPDGSSYWLLIGEAYVHGIMDGEAIRFGWASKPGIVETDFEIR